MIVRAVDNETIDLRGHAFIAGDDRTPPNEYTGRGIVVRNAKNVTIRNAKIRGFKIAIYAENCPNLTIENCDVSNNYRQRLKGTPQKEDESDWLYGHDNDNNEWLRYGAGIYLNKCDRATIRNCRARNGQNGICLVRCDKARVIGNDMSFMSGWGLAMWRSCACQVIGNRFDYCVRGYSHGVYARGQDSAGILVYEQCSDNIFAYNHATHGGDGFFLYAGNETVKKTGEGGCNRNLVYMNDFSYAVANGIEATFSDQNILAHNRLTHCNHGIWAGYSSRNRIVGNTIEKCANGVSIEHGRSNAIYANKIHECGRGIALWWDKDADLLASPYSLKQGAESADEVVCGNRFERCPTAIHAQDCERLEIVWNFFEACVRNLHLVANTDVSKLTANSFGSGLLENNASKSLQGTENQTDRSVELRGAIQLTKPGLPPTSLSQPVSSKSAFGRSLGLALLPWMEILVTSPPKLPVLDKGPPSRMETDPLQSLPGVPPGKEHIIITEWGPWDFTDSRPTTQPASRPDN